MTLLTQLKNNLDGRLIAFAGLLSGLENIELAYALSTSTICPMDYSGFQLVSFAWLFCAGLLLASVIAIFSNVAWSFSLISLFSILLLHSDARSFSNHLFLLCIFSALYFGVKNQDRKHSRLFALGILIQLSLTYFFSGISKLDPYFLTGASLLSYWNQSSLLPPPALLATPHIPRLIAVGTLILEISLAFLVWSKERYREAMAVGIVFHFGLVLTSSFSAVLGVLTFTLLVFSAYITASQIHAESHQ